MSGAWSHDTAWHISGIAEFSGAEQGMGGWREVTEGKRQGGQALVYWAYQWGFTLYTEQCWQVFKKILGVKSSPAVPWQMDCSNKAGSMLPRAELGG